ncbi:MAG: recombinase family protein [Planctomycetaceae bacterium]|nr:recombinase family protein [Planctomycetaceae bacterium]
MHKHTSTGVFGQEVPLRVGTYARVSTHDQQTLPLQRAAMQEYARRRGWEVVLDIEDIAGGTTVRPERERLLAAARRREVDVILCWRLDRLSRSVVDLLSTLQEMQMLGVALVSLTEALDFTTPSGRAMASMLAVFAAFERELIQERVKAGIAEARRQGKPHGRPAKVRDQRDQIGRLLALGLSKSEVARRLEIGRTSVRRYALQKNDGLTEDARVATCIS